MKNQPQTRTENTLLKYLRRAEALERTAYEAGYVSVVSWLAASSSRYRKATFRQYKASVTALYQSRGWPIEEISGLQQTPIGGKIPRRTSAWKKKALSDDDLRVLLAEFDQQKSQTAREAAYFLVATRILGYRPSEWPTATWSDAEVRVANAKRTNGRAHGESRLLHLICTDQEIALVRRWIDYARSHSAEEWTRLTARVAKCIQTAGLKVFNKRNLRVTLYSGRHQFCADAKASGLSSEEIAQMMGHGLPETSKRHYGKKAAGRAGKLGVAPDASEVQRVIDLNAPQPAPSAPASPSPSSSEHGESPGWVVKP